MNNLFSNIDLKKLQGDVSPQTRTVIHNVFLFLNELKSDPKKLDLLNFNKPREMAALICGVSRATVDRIKTEVLQSGRPCVPRINYKKPVNRKCVCENTDTYQSLSTKIRSQNDLHSTQVMQVDGGVSTSSRPMGSKGMSEMVGHNTKRKPAEKETVIMDDDNLQDNNVTTDPLSNKINQNPAPHIINNIAPAPHPVNISMGSESYVHIIPVNSVLPSGAIYLLPNTSDTQPQLKLEVNKSDTYILPELSLKKPRKREKMDDDREIVTDDDYLKTNNKLKERLMGEVAKLPIKTDSRVDWEDMIPMEVIACAEDKPVNNSTLKDATQDPLKHQQNDINMGTT